MRKNGSACFSTHLKNSTAHAEIAQGNDKNTEGALEESTRLPSLQMEEQKKLFKGFYRYACAIWTITLLQ